MSSRVTTVAASQNHGSATLTTTVETSPMNETAVSATLYHLTLPFYSFSEECILNDLRYCVYKILLFSVFWWKNVNKRSIYGENISKEMDAVLTHSLIPRVIFRILNVDSSTKRRGRFSIRVHQQRGKILPSNMKINEKNKTWMDVWPLCGSLYLFCSVLFLSRSRPEGCPHHGRTFSIYFYPLTLCIWDRNKSHLLNVWWISTDSSL